MPHKKKSSSKGEVTPPRKHATLKMLADYVGFAPATVSLVMNQSVVAESIPQRTKDLIFAAADKLHYRPNFVARSLRTQRTFSIGVLVPEISEGYEMQVLSGIEDHLLNAGYLYFVASHRHKPDLIEEYPKLLMGRSVDGIIAVDTPWTMKLSIPVVTVSGHNEISGVNNVVVDHELAAKLALDHLFQLGHRRLAFIKGQDFSSDTEVRWNAIERYARRAGIPVSMKLVRRLKVNTPSPELGYAVTRDLIRSHETFTAMCAFNDISAIGAIYALREAGLRVPEDVSIVGFDDILCAAYQSPGLTTVRQPLREMGQTAAETILHRIDSPESRSASVPIVVKPELIVRGTTGPVAGEHRTPESAAQQTGISKRNPKLWTPRTRETVRLLVEKTGLSRGVATTVVQLVAQTLERPN